MKKNAWLIAIILLLFIGLGIILNIFTIQEGAKNIDLPIPKTGLPDGYYKTGYSTMAIIPYGYKIDANNQTNIIPTTTSAFLQNSNVLPTYSKEITAFLLQVQNANISDDETVKILTDATSSLKPDDKIPWTENIESAYYNLNSKLLANINSTEDNGPKYDSNNYNVQYHADTSTFSDPTISDATGAAIVKDQYGNQVVLSPLGSKSDISQINYYQPGTYIYGGSTYVPNYEDSVYLSKSTNLSTVAPVFDTASIAGGICARYKIDPDRLENECRKIDGNVCASTSCCVLLGGSKCVSGDNKGPTMKSNYSDVLIKNRDFYYYQGKCYGNCPPY